MRKVSSGKDQKRKKQLPVGTPDNESFGDSFNAAVHFIGYRPRSEYEVRRRLQKHGFDGGSIDAAVAKLKRQGLLDDVAFAEFWKDDRNAFNPRSRLLLKMELKQKGITGDIVEQVTSTIDEEDSAYRAAVVKTRNWLRSDYESFSRRLEGYLKRRGFDYGVINRIGKRVWQESTESESLCMEASPVGGEQRKEV